MSLDLPTTRLFALPRKRTVKAVALAQCCRLPRQKEVLFTSTFMFSYASGCSLEAAWGSPISKAMPEDPPPPPTSLKLLGFAAHDGVPPRPRRTGMLRLVLPGSHSGSSAVKILSRISVGSFPLIGIHPVRQTSQPTSMRHKDGSFEEAIGMRLLRLRRRQQICSKNMSGRRQRKARQGPSPQGVSARLNISGAEEDEPAQLGGRLRGSAAGRRCRLAPRRRGLRGQRQTSDWLREDRRQIPVRQRFSGCRCHKAQRNGLLRKATSLGHAKVAGAPVMIAMFRGPVQEGFDQGPSRPWSRARFPLQRAMRERGALVCSVCCCACAAALRHKGALQLNICCLMPRSTWFVARGLRHVHEPGQAANAISRQACHACPGVPNKTQTLCSAKLHEDDVNRNIPKHNSYAARVCPKQEQRQQNGSTDKI